MKKFWLVLLALFLGLSCKAWAHFQLLIPSNDIVTVNDGRRIELFLNFTHPMEGGPNMEMVRPEAFGVFVKGKKYDLLNSLQKIKLPIYPNWHPEAAKEKGTATAWKAIYKLRRPGDHIFYVVPKPYFEPSEEKFILQITKVVVNAFGAEEGWDSPVGLKAEIIPLTRPYGLWEGNTFQGLVLINGKPAPNLEVEVEYYNKDGRAHAPKDPFVTQVIKTDENGVFTYTVPWAGWWGFSALGDGGILKKDGKTYPVELDAVIWIKAYLLPKGVK
ncbi:DUF4198 domain-containing protein [Thermodesulfatator autotrophicus]|uniref:ATP-dependent DNA ligase n=1 Tax=Thermodesulfatator autotrophicus TaxID=1795632 RepID=A0A177EC26_9BACT|nr:DUF4198 domain-containing protein [Thermodesulfatator autotrophicus]OAG28722.1 hypothetical protein TH606_00210 [Thermodesulfatator autotrophicus]